MCEHSQAQAIALGFRAMRFNFVVSTNERAVRLWQRLGFAIVGRLPGAFDHRTLGYVDAFVMFKQLEGSPRRSERPNYRMRTPRAPFLRPQLISSR